MPDLSTSFPVPTGIDVSMILPIMVVMITGIIALVIEIAWPKKNNNAIVFASLAGLVVAAVTVVSQFNLPDGSTLVDMVIRDRFSLAVQFLLVVACALTILFSEGYLREKRIPFGEFYPLVLWSTSGAMLMATSRNLLVIFLGLEILSIALYVMAGMSRSENKSEESALKYFLLGAFASGFFLYGMSFFYGATGSLDLSAFNNALMGDSTAKVTIIFGLGLMLVGLSFKSAFVPFHQWTPDVYQGAPTNVTAFMAVCSKIGAIAALFRVLLAASPLKDTWMPAMVVIAILTMLVGNAVALLQKDVKRILGYSSIAHAGYILVGLLAYIKAPDQVTMTNTVYYLMSYSLMTLGAFAIVSSIAKDGKDGTRLEDLRGLYKRNPQAALMLVFFMVSLIGIPPLAGFWGKLFIFKDAINAGMTPLAIVLATTSIISVAYYLQILWNAVIVDAPDEQPPLKLSAGLTATCTLCAAGVLLAGLFYTPITQWLMGPGTSTAVEAKLTPAPPVVAALRDR